MPGSDVTVGADPGLRVDLTKSADGSAARRRAQGLAQTNTRRMLGWVAGVVVLAAVCMLSIAIGAKDVPFSTVWDALWSYDNSGDHIIVRDLRIPRTILGLIVGVALGIGGASSRRSRETRWQIPGFSASTPAPRSPSPWRSGCSEWRASGRTSGSHSPVRWW